MPNISWVNASLPITRSSKATFSGCTSAEHQKYVVVIDGEILLLFPDIAHEKVRGNLLKFGQLIMT